MTTLEREILQIINDATNSEYISTLKVFVDDDIYTLQLFLNFYMSPMVFCYQGTEEEFKDFIKSEMKSRKLQDVFRYEVIRDILLPGTEECVCDEE